MSTSSDFADEFPYQIDEFYLDLQNDGGSIAILEQAQIIRMPFPGLRPFKTSEFQLFKGRGDQTEELINRLQKNNLLAVIGSSGTGKSSLVRAGLIPQLLGGYLHQAGNKWHIAICRPGKNPIENLAIALSSVKSKSKDRADIVRDFKLTEPPLTNSVYGLLDVNEMLNSDKTGEEKHNLLVIVDQFEELFRFQRKDLDNQNIESHFVNLLLKGAVNPAGSVYVIITMRSEFLGDCVKFRGLPEAINEGQYLVPQLTRNQLKEAIQGPIRLANKKIDPGLVELLINEIDENKLKENLDQLPILQHALMRSYNEAMLEGDQTEISYRHYEHIGTMKKALANHAEAKYAALGDNKNGDEPPSNRQNIAKIIFQALTDTSTDQKGGRRPVELASIYAISAALNAHQEEVDEVINHFREIETSFIMPPVNTTLHPGLILDISHESLMRNWDRLSEWMGEEAGNGRLYKMLNERRALNEQSGGSDQFIRGFLLAEMLNWEKLGHNPAWASRYHSKSDMINNETDEEVYTKNLNFLHASKEEAIRIKDLEKINLLNRIKLVKRTRRRIIVILTAAVIVFALLLVFALGKARQAETSAKEAKINFEIASEGKKQKNLLNFQIKLDLRKWWNDPYLTPDLKKQIGDSLVNWYFNHRSQQNLNLARRLDYALRIFHETVKLNHNDPSYLKLIVYAHQYDKNVVTDTIFNSLSAGLPENPANYPLANDTVLIRARQNIGSEYFKENNYTGTVLVFNEILDGNPGNALAYDMIGRACYASKKYPQAVTNFTQAVTLAPSNIDYLSDLGEAYIALQDYDSAERTLNKVIATDHRNLRGLGLLGQSLYDNEKYEQSISKFNDVIYKNDSVSSITYGWLIRAYSKLGKPDTEKYIDLLKRAPLHNYDDWFVLADYYDYAQDQTKAIFWYKKYISKGNKTFWVPYNNIALDFCRLKNENYRDAIKYADSAIALTGTQFMLTKKQLHLSRTIFVQSGTQFVPNPANPYAHEGYAYLIKSQTAEKDSIKFKDQAHAIINLDEALKIDPGYPKTHFYYACYHALSGNSTGAMLSLKTAIRNGFNDAKWIASEPMLNLIKGKPDYVRLVDSLIRSAKPKQKSVK